MNLIPLQNFGSHAWDIAHFNLSKPLNRLHIVIGAAAFAALALIALLWSRCIQFKSSPLLSAPEKLVEKKEPVLENLVERGEPVLENLVDKDVLEKLKKNLMKESLTLEDIQKNVDDIQNFAPELFQNGDFSEALIKKFPSDEKIALLLVKDNPKTAQFIDPHFLKDRAFAEKLVDINGRVLEFLTDFQADLTLVATALSTNKNAAEFIDPPLLHNRDLAFEIVKYSSGMELLPHFADDDEIGEAAVNEWASNLKLLSPRLRGKESVLLLAVKSHSSNLRYATDEALSDRVIAEKLVSSNGFAFEHLKKFQSDEEMGLLAVKATPHAIKYVDAILLKDPIIAPKFIAINSKDQTIALKTIEHCPEAAQYIDKDLLANRDFALQLIKVNKNVFPYLSAFQDDDEFKNLAK